MLKRLSTACLAVATALLVASSAAAQSTMIRGKVVDRDGNVVQQAAEGQNQGAGQGDGDNPSEENDETQERRLRLVATQDRP